MNPWLNMGYQLQPYGGAPVTPSPMMQPPVMPQTGMQAGMLGTPEGLTPGMLQWIRSQMPQAHGMVGAQGRGPLGAWMRRGFGGMGDARGRPGGYGGPMGGGGMAGSYGGGTGRTANGNSNSLGGGGLY